MSIKILTFFILLYFLLFLIFIPIIFLIESYSKKLATNWTNRWTLISCTKKKKEKKKTRIIFLLCIFLLLIILPIFFDYISRINSRTCYQTFCKQSWIDGFFIVLIRIWKTSGKLWIEISRAEQTKETRRISRERANKKRQNV